MRALLACLLLLAACGSSTYDVPLGDTHRRSFEDSVVGIEDAEGIRAGLLGPRAGPLSGFLCALEIPEERGAPAQVRDFLARANRSADPEAVKGCCEKAIAMDPGHPELWNNLGLIRLRLGDDRGAEDAFDEALDIDPGWEPAQRNLDRMGGRYRPPEREAPAQPEEPEESSGSASPAR